MKEQFAHLHVHGDASTLDGAAKIEDYVKAAAERGNPAIALTDHGTMRGAFELTEKCNEYGIKPIYGVEFYVAPDMKRRGFTDEEKAEITKGITAKGKQKEALKVAAEEQGIRKTRHITAWALDNEGLKNLYRLSSKAWDTGYYYRPRIDLDALCEHEKGLAVGTGCVGSVIYGQHWDGKMQEVDVDLGKLVDTFGDRLYLEIMPHDLAEGRQTDANRFACDIHTLTEGKHRFIATQDAHYLKREDAGHHDVLLTIGTRGSMLDPQRFGFDGESYWLKTRREMASAFDSHHGYLGEEFVDRALQNTVELAERCTAKIDIDPHKCLLPPVDIPEEYDGDEFAYLKALVMQGVEWRDLYERAERLATREGVDEREALRRYTGRIATELTVLRDSGFARYFLIIHDIYQWTNKQGIACGPGRGSAAGSLVSYLLGLTHVDPIEHRLMFERFISPGRINLPDFDCDFASDRRDEILVYLKQRYGEDRVAQISTMGRMQGKQVVKDVARVYDVSFQRANVATTGIDSTEDDEAIKHAIENSQVFAQFAEEYPRVVDHALALEGLAKSAGVHAAGIVTSPIPLVDVVPLEVRRPSGSHHVVTAFDMKGVEGVGLLKIDVLGLKAVTMLSNASKAIAERTGESFDLLDVSIEDKKTLDAFTARDFIGVFQFDSPSANAICDGMEFNCFDDIAVINSINRPGAKDFADEYKRRRKDTESANRHLFHPKVTEITKDALGLMIYQEHVIKVATDIAGMSASEADKLRKKIGKSEGHEALEKDRDAFVGGCARTTPDMNTDTANRLWDAVVRFGRYGFGRSHAVCYSLLGFWTMYLKQHHPIEFYWASMQRETDRKKIQRLARDAENHDVRTLLPDVNVSAHDFEIDREKNAIRGSLLDIHGIGDAAVSAIVKMREAGPFVSLTDFLKRRERAVNKRTVDALAKSGALDEFVLNPKWLVFELPRMWKHIEKERWIDVEHQIEKSKDTGQWTFDERMKEASYVNPLAMRPHPCITWESFLRLDVRPELQEIGDAMLATKQEVFCAGLITELEERTVGDSKSYEEMPPESVRRKIGWGNKWARLTVEGLEGKAWAKIDWRQYQQFKPIVDKGEDTAIVLCAETRPDYSNLHIHYLADVEELTRKMKAGEPLTIWERLFVDHPSLKYPWRSKAEKAVAMSDPGSLAQRARGDFRIIGVVAHLFENVDKRGDLMAWFGIAGVNGYQRVICFGSSWSDFMDSIRPGRLVGLTLKKMDDGGACLERRPRAVTVYLKQEAVVPKPVEEPKEERKEEPRGSDPVQQEILDDDIPF